MVTLSNIQNDKFILRRQSGKIKRCDIAYIQSKFKFPFRDNKRKL